MLQAAEHIRLGFAADEQSQHSRSRRSGFSIDNRDHLTAGGTFNDRSRGDAELSRLTGTQLSAGGRASLQAERGDISLIGSSAVAEQDLTLRAGGDIRLLSSQNSSRSSEREISSGIGSAVISDTEHFNGWMKHTRQERQQQVEQVRSQLGSLNGSVRMHAGENYVQQVADVVAAQDIDIQAKRIDILTDHNRSSRYSAERDVKIGNFAKISSPILDLINAVEGTVKGKEDGRTRALQGMAAAAKGYSTVAGNGALFKAEVGFGFKTARSQQEQSDEHSQSNTLAAGRNLSLTSREGDIRLQNTQAKAGDTLSLDSARDIILEAGGNRQRADGKNSHLGVSGGVGVSVGAGTGIYAYVEVGGGKGENHLDAQSHSQTRLQAKHLVINSQRDTTLSGARAEAERIDAHVGGRLQVESLQDQLEQSSKQSQGGVRVQVSFGTAWEVSGNYSAAQTSGGSRSVAEQSGLFAGQGGYHIRADQVHLKGGAIASAAPAEHNELTANRLTFENLHNHSDYSAQSAAISGSYGYNPNNEPGYSNGPQYNPGLPQSDSGSSESTTYAVLSEGDIRIGGERTSAQALGIRTRLDGANESVAALPDLQRLLQRQRTVSQASADIIGAAQTYSSNRAKEAERQKQQAEHDFRQAKASGDTMAQAEASARIKQAEQTKQDWGVGGSKNRALQAVTTVLTGSLGGQSGLQVASNTLAPYAATLIGDTFGQNGSHPNKAAQLLSHAILGAALAYSNGGDPAAGAASGAGAEAAAMVLTRTLYGEEAAKRPDLLPEQDKERIRTLSSAVAAVVGGVAGSRDGGGNAVDVLANAQVGGVIGRNAVENNQMGATRDIGLSSIGLNPQTAGGVARQINTVRTKLQETGNIEAAMEAGNKVARCDGCYDPAKEYSVALGFGLPVAGFAGATGGTLLAGGSIGLGGGASLGGGATGLIQVGRNVLPWAARTMANPMVKNGLINGGSSSGFSALSQYITTGSVNPKEVLFDGTTGFVAGTSSTKASMIFNNPYLRFSISSVTEIGIYSGSAALKNYAQGKPINRRNVLGAAYAANVGAGSTEVTKNLIDMLPRNNRYFNTLHTTKESLSPFVGGGVSTLFNMYYNNISDKVNYRNTRGRKNEK